MGKTKLTSADPGLKFGWKKLVGVLPAIEPIDLVVIVLSVLP